MSFYGKTNQYPGCVLMRFYYIFLVDSICNVNSFVQIPTIVYTTTTNILSLPQNSTYYIPLGWQTLRSL